MTIDNPRDHRATRRRAWRRPWAGCWPWPRAVPPREASAWPNRPVRIIVGFPRGAGPT